jgi:hypothetical protein
VAARRNDKIQNEKLGKHRDIEITTIENMRLQPLSYDDPAVRSAKAEKGA